MSRENDNLLMVVNVLNEHVNHVSHGSKQGPLAIVHKPTCG